MIHEGQMGIMIDDPRIMMIVNQETVDSLG